jgi:hypothetical protein
MTQGFGCRPYRRLPGFISLRSDMTTWLLTQPGLIVQAIGLDSQNLSRTMQVPAPVLSVHAHRHCKNSQMG